MTEDKHAYFCAEVVMERNSEYLMNLSIVPRLRYEQKVTVSGLQTDPYTIKD